jgi:hypothetical protein
VGGFLVNVHVRHSSVEPIQRALAGIPTAHGYLTLPELGWVSVYESRCSEQDDDWIKHVVQQMSYVADTIAIAFLIHDGDFLCYWLYDRCRLIDEYNSQPDYFESRSAAAKRKVAGRPKQLLTACRNGVSLKQVKAVFRADVDPYERLAEFADLLGIDSQRVMADYRNFSKVTAKKLRAATFTGSMVDSGATKSYSDPGIKPLVRHPEIEKFDRFLAEVHRRGQKLTELKLEAVQEIFAGLQRKKKPAKKSPAKKRAATKSQGKRK